MNEWSVLCGENGCARSSCCVSRATVYEAAPAAAAGARRRQHPRPQSPARSASGMAIERAHTHTEIIYLKYYYAGCSSKVLSK